MRLIFSNLRHPIMDGLKARQMLARGNAPGNRGRAFEALKGRNNLSFDQIAKRLCAALSGLDLFDTMKPGALPRAVILRPFRAGEGMVWA